MTLTRAHTQPQPVNITASNLIAAPGGEGDTQKVQLAEFAVYQTAPVASASRGPLLIEYLG